MGKGSKSNCKSASHKHLRENAKNRVDDLQGMFSDLLFARKESRAVDVAVLEEQVHQMLREWKAELNEPSPASSLQQGGNLGSFSTDIRRLIKLCEEEDDATSHLTATKPEPIDESLHVGDKAVFQESIQLFASIHIGLLEQPCTYQSGAGGNMQDTRDRIRALDDRKRALLLERHELVDAAAILHGGNGGN